MNNKSLEQAFNAIFHEKSSFEDFCSADFSNEINVAYRADGRPIFRTSPRLKGYLRFVDRVILRNLARDEDVVHSFIKGKSTLTAVKKHSSNKYYFLTDIDDFYSNIERADVERILGRDKDLIPISDFSDYIDHISGMVTYNGSIPAGFATSPQLSNAFLFNFDKAVKEFCEVRSISYTRYVDDIIISGKELDEVNGLKNEIQSLLHTYASKKIFLNKSKTKITHLGNKVKILGLVIQPNGKITIDAKHKNKIELLLYFYINNKEKYNDYLAENFRGDERSVFGLLHYAKSIDPLYLEKMQRKYGFYALSTLMENK